ncbi:helix-turn-helix domain-containing protein [Diplocloster agilis]|uniref:helix-turn-helix domain-containing protein n=1 Tax=Diplocloster agilis TaxID=2850323 RepID=UPI0008221895|nr:AraC family transcriptional regulator [Suonthocola fibrivorans]MCU6733816.1 AraC family transcriptional regulator [Suonthocola fibrivorans]SCJ10013.1 DNA-binding transcriptional regulator SoxS [uncultured Clostridium sp.]
MPNYRIDDIVSVIEYMEEHLTEKLNLDRVADAVHYSKYHLHRMFTGAVGITLHEYLNRRRLTQSAKLLVFSDKNILDIALLAGYESQQAFTNIFTAMYKMPPSRYREKEKFYPLQLKYNLKGNFEMLHVKDQINWKIEFAAEEDMPRWMELVRLVIDGFPYLDEQDYIKVLRQRIQTGQALILKDRQTAIGILLFSYDTGSIDFMGCHPLYRNRGIQKAFLRKVMDELQTGRDISITTYREGDKADTGQRREIKALGFAEAELLTEFGYPTQRFVLSTAAPDQPLP